ncbi:MAG TPA: 30S ribosomal protein S3 [Candidatus Wildermuthbacteria bacterium]|nr:30S ribosomal protein S3 [Candidatus Wildermuthbacteria bacterium]
MSHKVHPKAFRIDRVGDWLSRWIDRKSYAKSLKEDYMIRTYLEEKLTEHGVESIEIERFAGKTTVFINSSRPGLIIGRGGSGIEVIRKALVAQIQKKFPDKEKSELRLEIREIRNPWESATLTAQYVAQGLEKRMPFRSVMRQTLGKVEMNKGVQGVKIQVSGRLGGADIARSEKTSSGRLPLQTIKANIDYGTAEAKTTYCIVGVKVWIYKGDDDEEDKDK